MPSIGKVISGHNKKILKSETPTPPCNCTVEECPVNGTCQESELIYQCRVKDTDGDTSETYIGLTGNTFKDRYYKHKTSFRVQGYHKNTLSTHIWNLKRRGVNLDISWRIMSKARAYSPSSKTCELCIREIYFIMFEKHHSSLNSRMEFFNQCLHKDKYLLKNQ